MKDIGDFEEIAEDSQNAKKSEEFQENGAPRRLFMPRKGQLMGVVLQRLGGNRMSIKSTDGKTRNCRVPGRYKRKFWLRPGDAVIIEPWPDDDSKGDIVYQYRKGDKYHLEQSGFLKNISSGF
jgi:translation initiation factor 1A